MAWLRIVVLAAWVGAGCSLLTPVDGLSTRPAGDGGSGSPSVGAPDADDADASSPSAAEGGSPKDAGTCDADLNLDPRNCGSCGHDCLGGDCFGALCTPVTVVAKPIDPPDEAFAAHGGKVYWSSFSANTVHAGQNELVASGLDNPSGIAFAGDQLLIANYESGVLGTGLGPDAGVQPIASGLGHPGCFGVDATGVAYVSDYTGGRILRVAPSGTETIANGQSDPWGVAVIAGTVYWSNLGDGTIHRANTDGSSETAILNGEDGPACLVADDAYLYWVTGSKGIRRVERAGGTPKTITSEGTGLGIAVDAVSVYFTDGSKILRVAK